MCRYFLTSLIGGFVFSAFPVFAVEMPTTAQIKRWAPAELVARGVKIDGLLPVTLKWGEQAYLASVEYENSARNGWADYFLVRPALQQAMPLEGFGGQYNKAIPLSIHESQKFVVIGAAESGQGYVNSRYSVVYFDGWEAKEIYTVSADSNLGACGFDDRKCKGESVSIVSLDGLDVPKGKLGFTVVKVTSTSDGFDTPVQYKHDTNVVLLDQPW